MIRLTVNGQSYEVDVEPDTPLLWAIRENVGLTGTKYGCGIAQCGACTVHLDGMAVRSCSFPVSEAVGKNITTIEGLAQNGKLHPCSRPGSMLDVPQCGYCQSGMMMAVAALLKEKPKPTDADIDAAITNICRCGTYQRVRAGIHAAAAQGVMEAIMNYMPKIDRRTFLVSSAAAGLSLGFTIPFGDEACRADRACRPEVNAWVVVQA